MTSDWVQRFLRGLEIFVYSFDTIVCFDQKYTKFLVIFHYLTINCWSIKTFCEAAHRHFNIQQRHNQFCILNSCQYRFLFWTLLQLLQKGNYLGHKMTFLNYQAYYIDYPRYLRDTTFTWLNWYTLSFAASFILIRLTVASRKVVTGILC